MFEFSLLMNLCWREVHQLKYFEVEAAMMKFVRVKLAEEIILGSG